MNGKTARLLRRNGVSKKVWNSLSQRAKSSFRRDILSLGIGEKVWRKAIMNSLMNPTSQSKEAL